MTVIELPDEQAAALRAKAEAAGLTLEAWLHKLAGAQPEPSAERPLQTAANSANRVPHVFLDSARVSAPCGGGKR